jgi:SIT4-associating protein SAP185/190
VLACDIWAIAEGLLADSKDLLEPFWGAILSWEPDTLSAPTPHHAHPLFASSFKLPSHLESAPGGSESLSAESSHRPQLSRQASSSGAENGPGKGVLAGYWAKVNGFLLDKKPLEMLEFIKTLPMIVERFAAHVETPAVIDLLYRIIQCEESTPSVGIVDWLADRDLALLLVDLLSPVHSSDIHNNTSELLKAIIALSAPSPATLNQSADPTAPGYEGANGAAAGVVNNRIVRELASEEVVKRMVAFMLDTADAKDSSLETENAAEARQRQVSEEEAPRPLNPRDSPASEIKPLTDLDRDSNRTGESASSSSNRPEAPRIPITPESRASSLVTCIGIFIELIRKNNSDYFEQHLFHTLRSHLLKRQQEISEQRLQKLALSSEGAQKKPLEDDKEHADADPSQPSSSKDEEDEDRDEEEDEMEGMEEAMAEISEKLGIVHLGPMLRVLCEGLPDFQKLLDEPKASVSVPFWLSNGKMR